MRFEPTGLEVDLSLPGRFVVLRPQETGVAVSDRITDDSFDALADVAHWVEEAPTAASVSHYAPQVIYPARSGIVATSIGALASVTLSFQSPSSHTSG